MDRDDKLRQPDAVVLRETKVVFDRNVALQTLRVVTETLARPRSGDDRDSRGTSANGGRTSDDS
jgi:hypothetical protein